MIGPFRRPMIATLCCLCGMLGTGCTRSLEIEYGLSRGRSINGTGVLAEMFRERGDEVKTALRLTDRVRDWADVIVRFAPHPGLPGQSEADWYEDWLSRGPGRRLIYVVRDFDAEEEYWAGVIDQLDPAASSDLRQHAEKQRDAARSRLGEIPKKVKAPADVNAWFRLGRPADPPRICKSLGGPWADELTASQAAIYLHEQFEQASENVLLTGDEHLLAVDLPIGDDSRVLALANGSFVLNAAIVNPFRRRLASRILEWTAPDDRPRRVAFVDGGAVLAVSSGPPSFWDLLLRVASFRWVAIQMGILGLVACLARAPRLGRPRPEPTGSIDRPSVHVEALGELLFRTRSKDVAAQSIEQYRSWRHGRSGSS